MSAPVVPAVIPQSEAEVLAFAESLRFSPEFHLDIVDGVFVPKVSWPIGPSGDPMAVRGGLTSYTLEVDLMTAEPLLHAEAWVVAGADMLVFHVETLTLEEFMQFSEYATVSVGVSAHGATSMETLLEYAAYADYVQLMGIYEIGAQGQPFDPAVLTNIETVKQAYPDMMVSIDGSVNADTIVSLRTAGADRFICGSAIVGQPDPAAAHAYLSGLINPV